MSFLGLDRMSVFHGPPCGPGCREPSPLVTVSAIRLPPLALVCRHNSPLQNRVRPDSPHSWRNKCLGLKWTLLSPIPFRTCSARSGRTAAESLISTRRARPAGTRTSCLASTPRNRLWHSCTSTLQETQKNSISVGLKWSTSSERREVYSSLS